MGDNFTRTQDWKEITHPQILRQSALKAANEYAQMHGLRLQLADLMLLTNRFYEYFETGNTSWMKKAEAYLETKKVADLYNP